MSFPVVSCRFQVVSCRFLVVSCFSEYGNGEHFSHIPEPVGRKHTMDIFDLVRHIFLPELFFSLEPELFRFPRCTSVLGFLECLMIVLNRTIQKSCPNLPAFEN